MKVMIVEPDWRFAEQAMGYLESKAHLVVSEPDVSAALERVDRWQPDLVILAAELALQEGVVESLTASKARPAILLTERMDRFDRAWRAWQRGGDELLIKPVLAADELHMAIMAARENATAETWQSRRMALMAS